MKLGSLFELRTAAGLLKQPKSPKRLALELQTLLIEQGSDDVEISNKDGVMWFDIKPPLAADICIVTDGVEARVNVMTKGKFDPSNPYHTKLWEDDVVGVDHLSQWDTAQDAFDALDSYNCD